MTDQTAIWQLLHAPWLVLRREHIEAMPTEWKARFDRMLLELHAEHSEALAGRTYAVTERDEAGRFIHSRRRAA